MRKKIVAGNWKMNTTYQESSSLVNNILSGINHKEDSTSVIIIPPYLFLQNVGTLIKEFNSENVSLGAQNLFYEKSGAYTGEVSAPMLQSIGVKYALVGHSERRLYFNETSEELVKKVDILLETNLIPIYCCGESLEDRKKMNHFDVVGSQIKSVLFHLDALSISKIIIAYEPVWAIGTGETATPQQAQEMHSYIRNLLFEHYSDKISKAVNILYGGSCNAQNASELFAMPDIDGGLVGGASLKAEEFVKICNSF